MKKMLQNGDIHKMAQFHKMVWLYKLFFVLFRGNNCINV